MPKFDKVPLEEVRVKTASEGKREEILRECRGYIDQLKSGEAGQARGWCG